MCIQVKINYLFTFVITRERMAKTVINERFEIETILKFLSVHGNGDATHFSGDAVFKHRELKTRTICNIMSNNLVHRSNEPSFVGQPTMQLHSSSND